MHKHIQYAKPEMSLVLRMNVEQKSANKIHAEIQSKRKSNMVH